VGRSVGAAAVSDGDAAGGCATDGAAGAGLGLQAESSSESIINRENRRVRDDLNEGRGCVVVGCGMMIEILFHEGLRCETSALIMARSLDAHKENSGRKRVDLKYHYFYDKIDLNQQAQNPARK